MDFNRRKIVPNTGYFGDILEKGNIISYEFACKGILTFGLREIKAQTTIVFSIKMSFRV